MPLFILFLASSNARALRPPTGSITIIERQLCAVSEGTERHGDQCDLQRDSFLIQFTSKKDFDGRGVEVTTKCLISEEPTLLR